jgi:phosphatidyl-myo-inositol dimannoside synthase
MSIMKVILLAENWPPRVGGIESYLTNLARHLPVGSVDVVLPRGASSQLTGAAGMASAHRRFFWPLLRPAWLPLFIWLWRRCRQVPYAAMLCGKALFEGQVGYYLKKYLGLPYIVFTYAMEVETWQAQRKTRRALSRVLGAADKVVYINEVTGRMLRLAGVPATKLVKLPPGVGKQYLAAVSEARLAQVRHRYGLPPRYLLCVARLIERKGVDVLLEAFSSLDQTRFEDVQLIIAGDGPESARLAALTAKLWMVNSVQLLGYVPGEDLPALFAGAEIFVLTPRQLGGDYEGFGIAYLEAAASGVPAIGTATGGVPEAVLHERTGLIVPPDDAAAVTAALTRLLSDNSLRQQLGQAARERVRREFSWKQRGQQLTEIISSLSTAASGAA